LAFLFGAPSDILGKAVDVPRHGSHGEVRVVLQSPRSTGPRLGVKKDSLEEEGWMSTAASPSPLH